MRSVSSNVQLPELPDAKMETRKPMRSLAEPQRVMEAAVEDVRKLIDRRQSYLRRDDERVSDEPANWKSEEADGADRSGAAANKLSGD